MKGVMTFERELLEHIDMLKLAKEENDSELESVGVSRHVFSELLIWLHSNSSSLLLKP